MSTPYRDDSEALSDQLEALERELGALRDRLGELGDLKKAESDLEREIVKMRARIEARRPRSLLDDVRVASPCSASWDDMKGDDRTRFCGACQKNVYNLSAMTREDAERLIREKAGDLCARLYRRPDGTVLTADCSVGARRKRVRRLAMATVGGGMLAAGALLNMRQGAVTVGEITQGGIEAPPVEAIQGQWVMGDMPAPQQTSEPTPPKPTSAPVAPVRPRQALPPRGVRPASR